MVCVSHDLMYDAHVLTLSARPHRERMLNGVRVVFLPRPPDDMALLDAASSSHSLDARAPEGILLPRA